MPDGDGNDLVEMVAEKIAEQVPVKDVYLDGFAPATREAGALLLDTVKTVRLVLFPLQAAAYLNDRLQRLIEKAKAPVPPEQLIIPPPQLLGPIFEGIRYEPEGSMSDEAFSELLSRAFDRERVGQAHPGFPAIIRALADDELLILRRLPTEVLPVVYGYHQTILSFEQGAGLYRETFPFLSHPEYVRVYAEHLSALGLIKDLIGMVGPSRGRGEFEGQPELVWHLRLTRFGSMFVSAVSPQRSADG